MKDEILHTYKNKYQENGDNVYVCIAMMRLDNRYVLVKITQVNGKETNVKSGSCSRMYNAKYYYDKLVECVEGKVNEYR